jgi:hypothetical protein
MSGHIPLRAEQLYALHADLSAKFRRLEQIAYTFLEFLLLEIRGSSVAASQRIRAAKLKGSRLEAFKISALLLTHGSKKKGLRDLVCLQSSLLCK